MGVLKEADKFGPGARRLVLVGNPNVGKSVIFNALTGLYMDVSNFPGTTQQITCGRVGQDALMDTPGVYGLSSFNEEERIAREIVLGADIVINVVDAVHLQRDLFLTQQVIDMGIPVVVALNMVDEAARNGLEINYRLLENLLGVSVVPTVAVTKKGLELLKNQLDEATPGNAEPELMNRLASYTPKLPRREGVLILEGDGEVAQILGVEPGGWRDQIYLARRRRVNEVADRVISEVYREATFGIRLGHWMIRPITGFPILMLSLWMVYHLVGVFFAQTVVDFTEGVIMEGYYEPAIRGLIGSVMDLDSVGGEILAGQFGLLTMTISYIVGLLFPLVLGFFLVLSVLEDSGYLPRIAILVDRALTTLGLNGQAVIPLILGFGCVTMASITTRMLGSDRERRIAIFLLALAVPCSAQLAFITAVLAGLGPSFLILYILIIFSVLVGVGTLLGRFLPGYPTPLMIDLPPMRLPRLQNVTIKAWTKTYQFLVEAFPLFAGGALLLSVLKLTGALYSIQVAMEPLTVGWLQLPRDAANAFLMGFIRRDFGTAGILSIPMLPVQQFIALVTLTLFIPCIAATMVIFKERGWKEGLVIWPSVFILAFFFGGLLAQLFSLLARFPQPLWVPLVGAVVIVTLAAVLLICRPGRDTSSTGL